MGLYLIYTYNIYRKKRRRAGRAGGCWPVLPCGVEGSTDYKRDAGKQCTSADRSPPHVRITSAPTLRPLRLLRHAPPLLPLRIVSPGRLAPCVRLDCCRVVIAPCNWIFADARHHRDLNFFFCIDLLYILYLQTCIIRHDYKPFAHCIRWSIWHFFREFLGSVTVDI